MPYLKDSTKEIGQGTPEEDCKGCEDERELCALNITQWKSGCSRKNAYPGRDSNIELGDDERKWVQEVVRERG